MRIINLKQTENRDVISLFSGAMGLDLGLMEAGLNVRVGQDFDSSCVETIRANGHKAILGDIRDITPEEVLKEAGLERFEPFLVCGGPPCQPFSTAGKRRGINDPRGSLFMDFIRMIDYIRPRFFIMENVKGIVSSKLISEDDEAHEIASEGFETVLDVILNEFNQLGYKTVYGVLDAVNYGVPQFRERFILIGSRDSEPIFLPKPTHFQEHQNKKYRWKTLRDAIGDLNLKNQTFTQFSDERLNYLKQVPEGGNWKSLPDEIIEKAMGGAFLSGGGKVGFYRRLSFSQPSPTLVTSPVQKATMMCHPIEDRPLSVEEYARIQEFPDNWVLAGSTVAKYRQIGNAVPVGLARALGETLLSVAEKNSKIETKRRRGTSVHKYNDDFLNGGIECANK